MPIKLKKSDLIKVNRPGDIFPIMQRILLRENKINRNREHLWTICLDSAGKILNIELVSMGSVNRTVTEPMEVLSVPLQKRAVRLILVHNHPSGELEPSEADKDITDRLIQCGLIMHVPVLDHLIISENAFYSFADTGLLQELEKSTKYVPPYKLKERYLLDLERQAKETWMLEGKELGMLEGEVKGKEIGMLEERERQLKNLVRSMHINGYNTTEIAKLTGLEPPEILTILSK